MPKTNFEIFNSGKLYSTKPNLIKKKKKTSSFTLTKKSKSQNQNEEKKKAESVQFEEIGEGTEEHRQVHPKKRLVLVQKQQY